MQKDSCTYLCYEMDHHVDPLVSEKEDPAHAQTLTHVLQHGLHLGGDESFPLS